MTHSNNAENRRSNITWGEYFEARDTYKATKKRAETRLVIVDHAESFIQCLSQLTENLKDFLDMQLEVSERESLGIEKLAEERFKNPPKGPGYKPGMPRLMAEETQRLANVIKEMNNAALNLGTDFQKYLKQNPGVINLDSLPLELFLGTMVHSNIDHRIITWVLKDLISSAETLGYINDRKEFMKTNTEDAIKNLRDLQQQLREIDESKPYEFKGHPTSIDVIISETNTNLKDRS